MNKSELVRKLAKHDAHLSRQDFEKIVDAILHTIRDGLARGDRVELRSFGTFASRKHAARLGCNPRTKDPVSVSEKVVPAFKLSRRCTSASIPHRAGLGTEWNRALPTLSVTLALRIRCIHCRIGEPEPQ